MNIAGVLDLVSEVYAMILTFFSNIVNMIIGFRPNLLFCHLSVGRYAGYLCMVW